MTIDLLVKKEGMSTLYQEDGSSVGVTILSFSEHTVTQIKTEANDGYVAVQLTAGPVLKKPTKPIKGHCAQSNSLPKRYTFESRVDVTEDFSVGQLIKLDLMQDWSHVDAKGITKGKGFAGVMKRHNFAGQRATHGNSLSHRAPGSIGQCQDPGRVFKGKKMAGRMGGVQDTIQSLRILDVDLDNNVIVVKGSVPGSKGSYLLLAKALKKGDKS